MSYKDWEKKTIPANTIFSHGTTSKANVKSILNNGILIGKTDPHLCSMGDGLYAYKDCDPNGMPDESQYMIVFKTTKDLDGYQISMEDYNLEDASTSPVADINKYIASSDFYTACDVYVFHPSANSDIDFMGVIELKTNKGYKKQQFLQLP